METRVYRSLEELPGAYDRLFEETEKRSFFSSRAWFETLVSSALEPGSRLWLYGVERDGRALGLLPMRSPAGQNGSALTDRPLGPRSLASLTNFQTCEFEPLITADVPCGDAVLAAAVAGIAAERPRWSVIDFNGLEHRAGWGPRLARAFTAAGLSPRPYFYAGKIYDNFEGRSFDDFLATRPKSSPFREYRKKARKLERADRSGFRFYRGSEALGQGLTDYQRVRAESWKEEDYFPAFPERMIRAGVAADVIRLGVLDIDGEPAAADVWLLHGGRATAYRGCYSERFKRLSPGGISLFEMFRRVISSESPQEVDFGRDEEAYKLRWLNQRRELWGLVAFQPRSVWGQLSRLDDGARRAFAAFKRRVKQGRSRWRGLDAKTDERE